MRNKTMKKMGYRGILILSLLIISCKNETTPLQKADKKPIAKKELVVNMEFKTNKADELTFALNDIAVDELQKKNIQIIEGVIPTSSPDKFQGNFGEGNISRKFEIDLGRNELKEFQIFAISFKYGDKTINISPDELEKYFAFSKFSIFNKESKIITTIKVDNYHLPKLYARGILWDELTQQ
jgi:hypothetical protein